MSTYDSKAAAIVTAEQKLTREAIQRFAARARIRAAAPQLLEALKAIEEEISGGWQAPEDFDIVPDDDADTLLTATAKTLEIWKRVRAAIAKAEGRDA